MELPDREFKITVTNVKDSNGKMTTCKNNERIKKEVEIIVKVMKNPVRELAVDSTEPKKKNPGT